MTSVIVAASVSIPSILRHRKPHLPRRGPAMHTPLNTQCPSPSVIPCLDMRHAEVVIRHRRPYPAGAVHRAFWQNQ